MLRLLVCAFLLFSPAACWGADSLMNIQSAPPDGTQTRTIMPGLTLVVPDGRTAIIEEILPNGDFRTNLGHVISPDGLIVSGPNAGEKIAIARSEAQPDAQQALDPAARSAATLIKPEAAPETSEKLPREAPASNAPHTTPQITAITPEKPTPQGKTAIPPVEPAKEGGTTVVAPSPQRVTIAELLPTTAVPEEEKTPEKPAVKGKKSPETTLAKEQEKKKPGANKAAEKKKPEAKEPRPLPKPEKKEPPKKEPQPKPAPKKTQAGQHLVIPPEAAKTGNLSFLEGCWQGTRPEYYSKRTIKECFCFDANGASGKRRVFDPSGGRMCIGASRAHLSKDGTLSVTSSGASCTDGERWGSAEMVCRNSGPSTPCSWVFRDANNGRQSYQIPFVKVESCGR